MALSVALLLINQASALNCTDDCCRVKQLYSDLGGSDKDSEACCQVPGVSCSTENQVDEMYLLSAYI